LQVARASITGDATEGDAARKAARITEERNMAGKLMPGRIEGRDDVL
jgi:hypothetical protein